MLAITKTSSLSLVVASPLTRPPTASLSLSRLPKTRTSFRSISVHKAPMIIFNKLGFGSKPSEMKMDSSAAALCPDKNLPAAGQLFSQFGAGCFWGVELAFQRIPGITKTEVGYSQGYLDNPSYQDICTGTTRHSEVVRVLYDPKECNFESLLDVFWARHDPTTLNQ